MTGQSFKVTKTASKKESNGERARRRCDDDHGFHLPAASNGRSAIRYPPFLSLPQKPGPFHLRTIPSPECGLPISRGRRRTQAPDLCKIRRSTQADASLPALHFQRPRPTSLPPWGHPPMLFSLFFRAGFLQCGRPPWPRRTRWRPALRRSSSEVFGKRKHPGLGEKERLTASHHPPADRAVKKGAIIPCGRSQNDRNQRPPAGSRTGFPPIGSKRMG